MGGFGVIDFDKDLNVSDVLTQFLIPVLNLGMIIRSCAFGSVNYSLHIIRLLLLFPYLFLYFYKTGHAEMFCKYESKHTKMFTVEKKKERKRESSSLSLP